MLIFRNISFCQFRAMLILKILLFCVERPIQAMLISGNTSSSQSQAMLFLKILFFCVERLMQAMLFFKSASSSQSQAMLISTDASFSPSRWDADGDFGRCLMEKAQ